jgi:predicted phosphodiesterase
MKFQIISDIHTEFALENPDMEKDIFGIDIPENSKEVTLLIAGDLSQRTATSEFLNNLSQYYKNVVFVCGNHEFYGGKLEGTVDDIVAGIRGDNIYLLDNEMISFAPEEDVVIIGSTLWSDNSLAFYNPNSYMNDYVYITDDNGKAIFPYDTLQKHYEAVGYIYSMIDYLKKKHKSIKIIVLTHHLPSYKMIDKDYFESCLNPFYASNLESIMELGVDMWICGHTHWAFDEVIGNTRCIVNPRGYPGQLTNYNRQLIIDI